MRLPILAAFTLLFSANGRSVAPAIPGGKCPKSDEYLALSCVHRMLDFDSDVLKCGNDRAKVNNMILKNCDALDNCPTTISHCNVHMKLILPVFTSICKYNRYLFNEFAECNEKLDARNSTCKWTIEKNLNNRKEGGWSIFGEDECFKKEIVNLCGDKAWDGFLDLKIATDLALRVPRDKKQELENQHNIQMKVSIHGFLECWTENPRRKRRYSEISNRAMDWTLDDQMLIRTPEHRPPPRSPRRVKRGPATRSTPQSTSPSTPQSTLRSTSQSSPQTTQSGGSDEKDTRNATEDMKAWNYIFECMKRNRFGRFRPSSKVFWEGFVKRNDTKGTAISWRNRFIWIMHDSLFTLDFPKLDVLSAYKRMGRPLQPKVIDGLETKYNVKLLYGSKRTMYDWAEKTDPAIAPLLTEEEKRQILRADIDETIGEGEEIERDGVVEYVGEAPEYGEVTRQRTAEITSNEFS